MTRAIKTVFHNGHRYKIVRTDGTVTVSVMTRAPASRRHAGRWRRILHEGPTGLKVLAKEERGW